MIHVLLVGLLRTPLGNADEQPSPWASFVRQLHRVAVTTNGDMALLGRTRATVRASTVQHPRNRAAL
jgi:hypothetical protein